MSVAGCDYQPPHRVRRVVPDLSGELWVVKERDVLWPCEPHHHSQPVSQGDIEQLRRRHRVGADRVDSGSRHQHEILIYPLEGGELMAIAIGREGAIGDPLDEETPVLCVEKLAVDARRMTSGLD